MNTLKRVLFTGILLILISNLLHAQLPPAWGNNMQNRTHKDNCIRRLITPASILWTSDQSGKYIQNPNSLLKPGTGQVTFNNDGLCSLMSKKDAIASILLDFGKELNGGIQLVAGMSPKKATSRFRIRFGETVSEAMAELGEKNTTNDHAIRDFELNTPWFGNSEAGNSGFRFVRIDLLDTGRVVLLKEVNAVFKFQDVPYLGSFRCNDDRLNKIWETGAYTVHLCMQDYIFDGIKRDRLVWIGDCHPETMTIQSVFGYNDAIPRSLDFVRNSTPLPNYMNKYSSYSMWWIIIHRDWFNYQGDLAFLKEQKGYLLPLLDQLIARIKPTGEENLDGLQILDWPSSKNKEALHAGMQSLMIMTMKAGADLCGYLNEPVMQKKCLAAQTLLQKHIPDPNGSKQATAAMILAGLASPEKMNKEILAKDPSSGISPFFGYYILKARAKAGDYTGAMNLIRDYWGAMLDLGATTFWENFTIENVKDAARIDQLIPEGKKDIIGDYGDYCYIGFRHSLCHGWASGPTAWLSEYVLGISILEPGCKTIQIAPHLGDLQWAEGTYPTPMGVIHVRHDKNADGKIKTTYDAPKGVKVVSK